MPLVISLIDAGTLQNLGECYADFFLDNRESFFARRIRSKTGQYLGIDPLCVLGQRLV